MEMGELIAIAVLHGRMGTPTKNNNESNIAETLVR
ncbi:hypothetical protein MNBD_GAMMA16-1727 [hydrothermal vent metagenome]|uniref:Uncharacterized protein n=1 Tax=hydrothermal vent metagenome TaxID=652676 RepID=A0A3B1A419_9ZZZZ